MASSATQAEIDTEKRRQLFEDGFCTFPAVLDADMLARLRAVTDRMLDAQSDAQRERTRSQGSMLTTREDPLFADLIAHPKALAALHSLGFPRPTFSDGYVISKPGRGPRLFWHYDWFAWQDPRSYELPPPQVFAMYYLSDTTSENGCLRVIPGSHVRHNPLHDALRAPHSEELGRAKNMDAVEFSTRPDEVDVPVSAGDLLVGDARLLHAAHSNETDAARTLITLWYQPDLASLPERMQAQVAAKVQATPDDWPAEARETYAALLARYDGDAAPYEGTLYRPRQTA